MSLSKLFYFSRSFFGIDLAFEPSKAGKGFVGKTLTKASPRSSFKEQRGVRILRLQPIREPKDQTLLNAWHLLGKDTATTCE